MSRVGEYILDIAYTLERMTGYDAFTIMDALEDATSFDFSPAWPDTKNRADMRRLFNRLRPWLEG